MDKECIRCKKVRPHCAKGMCVNCYNYERIKVRTNGDNQNENK